MRFKMGELDNKKMIIKTLGLKQLTLMDCIVLPDGELTLLTLMDCIFLFFSLFIITVGVRGTILVHLDLPPPPPPPPPT